MCNSSRNQILIDLVKSIHYFKCKKTAILINIPKLTKKLSVMVLTNPKFILYPYEYMYRYKNRFDT